MKVLSEPPLIFTCPKCGATCQGDESDFKEQHTMPPTWKVKCGYCHLKVTVSPPSLIAKLVGTRF